MADPTAQSFCLCRPSHRPDAIVRRSSSSPSIPPCAAPASTFRPISDGSGSAPHAAACEWWARRKPPSSAAVRTRRRSCSWWKGSASCGLNRDRFPTSTKKRICRPTNSIRTPHPWNRSRRHRPCSRARPGRRVLPRKARRQKMGNGPASAPAGRGRRVTRGGRRTVRATAEDRARTRGDRSRPRGELKRRLRPPSPSARPGPSRRRRPPRRGKRETVPAKSGDETATGIATPQPAARRGRRPRAMPRRHPRR